VILIGLVLEIPVGLLMFCFNDKYALQKESDAVHSTNDLKPDHEDTGVRGWCTGSAQMVDGD